uniref:Uncharacterized protein n=2 Tax=Cyprinus carpio TaxID=7962 RepID=A0A8C1BD99_CYPCA
ASFNFLKMKHETLRSSQESEMLLLQEAKALHTMLGQQKQELEKAELFPEGPDTEVSRMKQTLLQYYNQILFLLFSLKEKKLCLEKEYQDQSKLVVTKKKNMALKNSCEEVRKEMVQLRQEVKTLTEKQHDSVFHQAELAQVLLIPVQLGKEIDRVAHKKSNVELENQITVIEQHRQEHMEHQQKMETKCKEVKEAKRVVVREMEGHKSQLVAAENKQDRLLKELQMTKEKEAIFMDQMLLSQSFSTD